MLSLSCCNTASTTLIVPITKNNHSNFARRTGNTSQSIYSPEQRRTTFHSMTTVCPKIDGANHCRIRQAQRTCIDGVSTSGGRVQEAGSPSHARAHRDSPALCRQPTAGSTRHLPSQKLHHTCCTVQILQTLVSWSNLSTVVITPLHFPISELSVPLDLQEGKYIVGRLAEGGGAVKQRKVMLKLLL